MYVTRLSGSLGRAVEPGIQAAAEAEADPTLQAEMYEMLSRISDDDIGRKLDTARAAAEAIDRVDHPDPYVVFHVQAALVEAEFYAGLGNHVERLEGVDPGPRSRFPPVRAAVSGDDLIGRLLAYAGRIDDGLEILRGMYDRAAVESRSTLPAILGWMAEAQILAGRFAAAVELTREAVERSREIGAADGSPWEVGFLAVGLALAGPAGRSRGRRDPSARRRRLREPVDRHRPRARPARARSRRIGPQPARRSRRPPAPHRGRQAGGRHRRPDRLRPRRRLRRGTARRRASRPRPHEVLARFEEQAERCGGRWARAGGGPVPRPHPRRRRAPRRGVRRRRTRIPRPAR